MKDMQKMMKRMQGQGLGTTLLGIAETEASRHHDSIYLYTHETMTENLELYQRRGYRPFRQETLPDGSTLRFLRKQLSRRSRRGTPKQAG